MGKTFDISCDNTISKPPTIVYLLFKNMGKLDAEFNFQFPTDDVVEVDRWAEDKAPKSEEEQKELDILYHELFQIEPKVLSFRLH